MSLFILSPLLYLLLGFAIGRSRFEVKRVASSVLTNVVIPLVIVYNIVTYQPGLVVVVLGVMAIMATLALIGKFAGCSPIRTMCFFYLNIGWLGLPVATALFGNGAASLFVAAYIGSTIFGNSIGAGMLGTASSFGARLAGLAKSPPMLSVAAGLLLLPARDLVVQYFQSIYEVAKFLLSVMGMAILGIWLSESKIRWKDIQREFMPSLYRSATLFILLSLFLQLCRMLEVTLVTQNIPALYLICLLPPAANIIVLETHYLKTGESAKIIASGTCIGVIAMFLYALAIHALGLTVQTA